MPDTMMRQWQMLRLVPRAPRKIATAQLEEALSERGYLIDRRSIQRDLAKLSLCFPLICDNRSKPYGWSWDRHADPFDLPGMDLHGALSFRLAAEYLEHLLPPATRAYLEPHFRQATTVLDNAGSGRALTSWPDKVRVIPSGLARVPADIDPIVLEAAHTALLEDKRLEVSYCRRGQSELRTFDFSPLALVYRDAVAYLVGTAREYDDLLQLALHRVKKAEVVHRLRREHPGFDIDAYIGSGAFDFAVGDDDVRLRALFDARVAPPLLESPIATDQATTTDGDGRLLLTATVPDTNQLRVWLRGFGPYVEVLTPVALRDELAASLREAVRRYDTTD